jgi:hypothetical protein
MAMPIKKANAIIEIEERDLIFIILNLFLKESLIYFPSHAAFAPSKKPVTTSLILMSRKIRMMRNISRVTNRFVNIICKDLMQKFSYEPAIGPYQKSFCQV